MLNKEVEIKKKIDYDNHINAFLIRNADSSMESVLLLLALFDPLFLLEKIIC